MAILLSVEDGNINATASWAVVEPTSFQGTPNATLTAAPTLSTLYTATAFTLASAVTVAGVALQLSGRVASPTGTLNVQLFDVTGAAIIGQVTINISDLPNSNGVGNNHIDWVYFRFVSPVTTIAGRSYAIRLQASVISQYSWYYTGTTTNPNRALVTTTNQAPVSNDPLIIAGSYTSTGVNSTTTITMNYDSNNTITNGNIWISSKGILTFSTAFSTLLSITGYLVIGVEGTLIIGTSLTPIPSNYLAALQMNCTTALQYPIWVYGTMTTYGAVKTPGVKLTNDSLVGATSSTLSSSPTGWLVNDLLVVTSTSRNYTELELKYISSISGNIVNHTSQPNSYSHGGNATTKVQADVVNIYRNIYIQSIGDIFANKTNIQMFANSITSFYYTTFYSLGTGITVANSGICVNILNTGYTFEMQYCSIVQGNQASGYSSNTALFNQNTSGTTISNNIFYGLGWSTTTVSTIISTNFDDGNYIIGCLATSQCLLSTNMGSNNVVSSNSWGATTGFFNNATNNSFYSNNQSGLLLSNPSLLTNTNLSSFKIWRNNAYGIIFNLSSTYNKNFIISFDDLHCFGNNTGSINITNKQHVKVYFNNSFFYGGTTLVQLLHFSGSNGFVVDTIYYNNCYFGYSDSSLKLSPFSSTILQVPVPSITKIFNNCYFNGNEISTTAGYPSINLTGTYMSLNHNGMTGSNRQWLSNGTIYNDGLYVGSTNTQTYSPNLVKWTENMRSNSWTKSTLDTITLFQLAPDGSYTAMLIDETGASDAPNIVGQGNIIANDTTITYSIYTKTVTATTRTFLLRNTTTTTNFDGLVFNYSSTGNLGNGWTSTDVGSGWFRISYTRSSGITFGDTLQIYCGRTGAASAGSTASWYIWGPQVNKGSNALVYQKTSDINFDMFTTLGKSLRLTPSSALYKLTTPLVKVPVKIGTTCTISVKIRRSSSLDLTTYNGNLPRLMYAFNPILGNVTETIASIFPTMTNLINDSEDFDSGVWSKLGGASITANTLVTLAPDNTNSSDIFNTSPGSTTPLVVRTLTSVADSTYSLSIYVKSGTNNFIQIRYVSNGTLNSYVTSIYNTTLGTITQTAVGSAGGTLISNSITSVGNGWFRLALVASIPQSDLNVGFIMARNATGNLFGSTALITNGGFFTMAETMYIWGALLEQSSVTSEYISQGSWQTLNYTTGTFSNDGVAEFYVDCDGTTGWINVDDWNVTTSVDSRTNDYWGVNATYVEPDFKRGTYTFVK